MDSILEDLRPLSPIAGRDIRWTLAERLAHYRVPGLSLAIIDGGRVVHAEGVGLANAVTGERVERDTLFQACSMSKPLAGLAVMRAVDRGELDLDAPVNSYLRSWRLPDSGAYSARDVTLARLLSHSAGVSVPGFKGYRAGQPLPTTLQVLDGLPPANSAPVRIVLPPGEQEEYSGGGSTIVQRVLEETSGEAFPSLLQKDVLQPLGMSQSTFAQPLPVARAAKAASGHDGQGQPVPGGSHIYPEYAAAGLWTTAADYALFLIGLQRAAASAPDAILSASAAGRMMTAVGDSSYGIGPELAGAGETLRFGHSGGNAGFCCDSRAYLHLGKGAVVLLNGEGADKSGWSLTRELMNAIARAYAWPDFLRPERHVVTIAPQAARAVEGEYRSEGGDVVINIRAESGTLVARVGAEPPMPLLALSDVEFFSPNSAFDLQFDIDGGRASAVNVRDGGRILFKLERSAT